MKIVREDNFNRDYIPDYLVAENIQSEYYANVMCKALNQKYGSARAQFFFVVKPDDYALKRFEP